MDATQVENLLSAAEGSTLDFKSEIDLDSKRGKADFLVEVLGLANAANKPAYLVLGVQDKPRKTLGLAEEITEERIQKVLADNCRPPIRCVFDTVAYRSKRVGILTIEGSSRPYVLKKDLGFQDERGKQHTYTDKQVFVRRGSAGDTATPDESIEMALERQQGGNTFIDVDGLQEELYQISSKLYHLDDSIRDLVHRNDRERSIEYVFLGISSGLLVGIFQVLGLNLQLHILGIILSTFWISIFASALKIVRFGLIRSILISLVQQLD
jgi:hypothetical protein